ncbi:MAG: hypothetical protein K0Q51_42 [Rickettsiaceae bacterium]|nr:hypothetical protein [Rickettsiaceae bacterium]
MKDKPTSTERANAIINDFTDDNALFDSTASRYDANNLANLSQEDKKRVFNNISKHMLGLLVTADKEEEKNLEYAKNNAKEIDSVITESASKLATIGSEKNMKMVEGYYRKNDSSFAEATNSIKDMTGFDLNEVFTNQETAKEFLNHCATNVKSFDKVLAPMMKGLLSKASEPPFIADELRERLFKTVSPITKAQANIALRSYSSEKLSPLIGRLKQDDIDLFRNIFNKQSRTADLDPNFARAEFNKVLHSVGYSKEEVAVLNASLKESDKNQPLEQKASKPKKNVGFNNDVGVAEITSLQRGNKEESYELKKDTFIIKGGLREDASEIEAGISEAKRKGQQPKFESRLGAKNKEPYYQRTQEAKEAYYDRMKQKPELYYKTDMEVFQGVVGKDMKDKQAHKVITIVSAKEDKSHQINLTFRAKDPKENFVVRGLKNLFNMDKVKVSIDKQEFNDKFHNSKFQNKDLKEIYKNAPPQKRNFITSELGARTAEEMRQISPDGKEFDPNQFSLVAHATIKNAATLKNIKANPVSKLANKIKRAPQTVKKFLRGEKDKGGRSH